MIKPIHKHPGGLNDTYEINSSFWVEHSPTTGEIELINNDDGTIFLLTSYEEIQNVTDLFMQILKERKSEVKENEKTEDTKTCQG